MAPRLQTSLLYLSLTLSCDRASTTITLPGTRSFPESITSTSDGALIIGSLGHGNVLRIAPGATQAVEWIKPGTGGLNGVLGVYADEASHTLWICSNNLQNQGEATSLKAFSLENAALKTSYVLPGGAGSLCNDIAVADDGTAYVSDTRQATVFMLKPGATALEVAAKDSLLASADGLAFGDRNILYVNGVETGKLLRLDLGPDGTATRVVELKLSTPLKYPDGMRAIGKHRLLVAENAGKMDIITVNGPELGSATVQTIKSGLDGTTAVTVARGLAWVVEGKLEYMDDPKKDPGEFKLHGVPLPRTQ